MRLGEARTDRKITDKICQNGNRSEQKYTELYMENGNWSAGSRNRAVEEGGKLRRRGGKNE